MSKFLKNEKNNHIFINKKNKNKYMAWFNIYKYKNSRKIVLLISLHVFLDLITSLLKP
jgi:hypothetical protein